MIVVEPGESQDDFDDSVRPPAIPVPDQLSDPVGWLIYRLTFYVEEQLQDGPVDMVRRAQALAQLYQAKSLQRIAEDLTVIREHFEIP